MVRLLLASFILLCNCCFAQPDLQWAHGFASSDGLNYGQHMAIDGAGNVYTIGRFTDSTDFDTGPGTSFLIPSSNAFDTYISKHDVSGNFVWCIHYNFGLMDISVDNQSNIYVVGSVRESVVDFDPGSGEFNVFVKGRGAFVSKFNSSGSFIFAKVIESNDFIIPRSIATDQELNTVIVGEFIGKVDFDSGTDSTIFTTVPNQTDIFVWKLDQNGNYLWAKTFGAGWNDSGFDIATDDHSNVYLTGKFMKYVDFDPGPNNFTLYSTLWDEIFVCKLTKNGDFIWAKQFGADGLGVSIKVDKSENVVFAGYFKASIDFDPGAGTHIISSTGGLDVFLAQLNKHGELNWVHTYGDPYKGGYIHSIELDDDGNVYTIGGFSGSLELSPDTISYQLTSEGNFFDIFLMNLKCNGQLIWGKKIGGRYIDIGYDLAINCGNIFITGIYGNQTDFDPGHDTAFLFTRDSTVGNIFISKFALTPSSPDLVQVSNDSICSGEPVSLSVNGAPLGNGTNWQWYQGSCGGNYVGSGSSINILPAVSTTFYVRSEGNCRVSDCKPVSVNLKESPDASASLTCKADCSGVTMHCKNESVNADSYTWRFNDGSNSTEEDPEHYFTFNEGFGISLTAINSNSGCMDTFNLGMSSVPLDWFRIVIPNVFTPNNDGINDELRVSSEASINNCFSLKVFNRWGNEIYSSNNLDSGWNGRSNSGESSEPGTYYYVLKVDEFEYQGTVTLLE